MSTRTKFMVLISSLLLGMIFIGVAIANTATGVMLYTPYTKISVPPGESIDYSIDIINKSSGIRNVEISLTGFPKGWNHDIKSGGWSVEQISILPDEKKSVSLRVEVPLQVDKGSYRFNVVAKGLGTLPLTVTVSEQGTFRTEFITKQPNMEGHASSSFTFNTDLKNRTGGMQLYALKANAPRGWNVIFKPNYTQATSVNVEANNTANITVEIKPPAQIEAGTYKIPVYAVTSTTSAELELEVAITGSYDMQLTTPRGLLSTNITAGDEKRVELQVRNTGSSELKDIKLEFSAPVNWDVIFDPVKLDKLEPGNTAQVFATIKADKKAIAGDYVLNIDAKTPEVSSKASFRVSVKTPMLWGGVGVLFILIALGNVYYLFRKYGRR
jgi:uncharacterized membrane protein